MRPQDILPDHINHMKFNGLVIRKGTIAAFLCNARIWCDPDTTPASRAEVERDIIEALPALHALDLFEVLAVRDDALRELIAEFDGRGASGAQRL
jgi:hypothetical protein